MTTNQILNLDCRINANKETIQKVLKLIKPFKKYNELEDVKQSDLEKFIKIVCMKYNIRIHSIRVEVFSNKKEIIWKATIVNESNLFFENMIYGLSIYEVLAKSCIKLYSMIQSDKTVKLRREEMKWK